MTFGRSAGGRTTFGMHVRTPHVGCTVERRVVVGGALCSRANLVFWALCRWMA